MVVAQINQTQVSAIDFLQALLVQFGFSPFKMKKAELIATINTFLIEQYAAGRKVLLIVDEAQNLSMRVLEEIRLLSGVETTKEKVLRIILCGQPELNEKLNAPELVQLTQRIRLRFHLSTLSQTEMRAYIQHRLEVAGAGDRQIFAEDTFPEIFRYTGGVPRLINTLCDTSMMAAFAADRDNVTLQDVQGAVDELQWVEYSTRTAQHLKAHDRADDAADAGPGAAARHCRHACWWRPMAARCRRSRCASAGSSSDEPPTTTCRSTAGSSAATTVRSSRPPTHRVIEDLNSTNGIYVKSKRVRRHYLNDGDVVVIGKHELIYVDERLARTRASLTETVPGVHVPAARAAGDRERRRRGAVLVLGPSMGLAPAGPPSRTTAFKTAGPCWASCRFSRPVRPLSCSGSA